MGLVNERQISLKYVEKTKKSEVRYLLVCILAVIVAAKVYLLLFILDPITGLYSLLTSFLIFSAFLVTYTKYKDPTNFPTSNNRDQQPLVSIIVAAKNEPVIIKECVESCLESSYLKTEVILINDGSTDETGKVMDMLYKENSMRVKVIHLATNLGKRKAIREAIICEALGSIVVFIDSDSIVDKTAVEKLVRVFDDPRIGGACGHARIKNVNKNILTKMQDTWYDTQYSIMKGIESSFDTVTCCPGPLSAYRREAIMPFLDSWCNDKFLGSEFRPGDDRAMTSYILGGGKYHLSKENKVWKTKYCESAIVLTEAPSKFKGFINQQIRWKKSWFRMFCFTAPFYYRDRSLFAAAFYYLQMVLSFISPLVVFRALILLPLQGNYLGPLVYFSGILLIGLLFAAAFKLQNPDSGYRWFYRILMSLLGVFLLSFLMYYAILTIRRNSWLTR